VFRDLASQIGGELGYDLRGGSLNHAGAAAILRYRTGQHEVCMNEHLGPLAGRFDPERRGGNSTSALFGIVSLRFDSRFVTDGIEFF
jgi:hypothetical protein